jgi:predicted transcriptional regulator
LKQVCEELSTVDKEKLGNEAKKPVDPYSVLDSRKETSPNSKMGDAEPLDVVALLALPDSLRKTALALLQFDRATAAMIASETGRTVDAERIYLMKLCDMGYVKMEEQAQDIYFSV